MVFFRSFRVQWTEYQTDLIISPSLAPKAAEIKAEVEAKVEEAIKPPPEEPPQLEFMTPMPSVSAQDL